MSINSKLSAYENAPCIPHRVALLQWPVPALLPPALGAAGRLYALLSLLGGRDGVGGGDPRPSAADLSRREELLRRPVRRATVRPVRTAPRGERGGRLGRIGVSTTDPIGWEEAFGALYAVVAVLLAGLLLGRWYALRRLRRQARLTPCAGYTLAESERIKSPFSFWRTIFLGLGYTAEEREQIICHERSHIRRLHTLDRLVLEVLRILFWFNPFIWIAERWLMEVQEWQADEDVLREGYDRGVYQQTIFKQLFGYCPDITCGLSNSFTKKRFLMMTRQPRGRCPLLRLGAALPLVAGMVLAFGATAAQPKVAKEEPSHLLITPDTKLILNGQELTPEELRQYRADEWIKAGKAAMQQADELNHLLTERKQTSQAAYDTDRETQKRLYREALAAYERANELRPNDRRILSALNDLCFRLRDEEGMKERYDRYAQARRDAPAELMIGRDYLLFNGQKITQEELPQALADYRSAMSDPRKAMIRISAEGETSVGQVQDCKELMREAGVLRVQYESMGIGANLLPPSASTETAKVTLLEPVSRTVKARNCCLIRLNRNGKLLCGTMGYEQVMERGIEGVCDYVKCFITNPDRVRELSEQQERSFTLPDGREVLLPVSRGMLSIEVANEVSASTYMTLMNRISQTYGEIRAEVAQRLFDRPMALLTDAEREVIHRAIPIRFSEEMVRVR